MIRSGLQELREDRRAMIVVGLMTVIAIVMVTAGGLIYRDRGRVDKMVGASAWLEVEDMEDVEVDESESTYIVLEFGPRVMFHISKKGVVVGVFRLNDEAVIFSGGDFAGMGLRDAMNKMVGVAIGRGYMTESTKVTVSVMDKGNEEYLEETIGVLESNNIEVIRMKLHKMEQADISVMRWNYVEKEVVAAEVEEGEPPVVGDTGGGSVEPENVEDKPETVAPPVVVQEKTFTAYFHKNGAMEIGAESLSCKTTGKSCAVVAPSIVREGYEIFGWSTSVLGVWLTDEGGAMTLTGDANYYAIMMEKADFIEAGEMLSMVNEERAKVGVGSLSMSRSLLYSAKVRAKEICGSVSHTRPDGSSWTTVNPLAYGENLAGGLNTVAGTFGQWMASEGHRNNMVNPTFKTVGIAGYRCVEGEYRYYWVQLFGR